MEQDPKKNAQMMLNILRIELFAMPLIVGVIVMQVVPEMPKWMLAALCAGAFALSFVGYVIIKKQYEKTGLLDKGEKQSEQR